MKQLMAIVCRCLPLWGEAHSTRSHETTGTPEHPPTKVTQLVTTVTTICSCHLLCFHSKWKLHTGVCTSTQQSIVCYLSQEKILNSSFLIKSGLKQFIIDLVTSNQLMTHSGMGEDQGGGSVQAPLTTKLQKTTPRCKMY